MSETQKIRPAYFIRPLIQTDEQFLWEMLYQALYVPPGGAPFPPEILNEPEIARYVQDWGRAGDAGFAAIDDATLKPVGAAWIRLFSATNQGYGYVDDQTPELSTALLPAYRHQGIGTALLSHLIADAAATYPALSLSVSSDNPAIRLYQRLGFAVISESGNSLTMRRESSCDALK
jgi:ribosomal protein S18 acetylase RimI-like enzyme